MKPALNLLATFFFGAMLALFAQPVSAQNPTWFGGSGSWDNGANWSTGSTPASNATVYFSGGSGTVTPGIDTIGNVLFTGTGNYTLNSGTIGSTGEIDLETTGTNVTLTINSMLDDDGSLTIANDSVDPSNTVIIGGTLYTPGETTVTLGGNGESANIFSGPITGYGSQFIKNGSDTWILTGSNTVALYVGNYINGGTLQIGNGGTDGYLPGYFAPTVDNATLVFDRSDTLTEASTISGTGQLIQNGSGQLILQGDNTNSGGTIINSGTLVLMGNTGSGGIVNNSVLYYERNDTFTENNVISGTGSVAFVGRGTITLAAANTYTGPTEIATGMTVVALANGGIPSSLGASSNSAANLVFEGGGSMQFGGGTTDRLFTIGSNDSGNVALLFGTASGSFTNTGAIAYADAAPHGLILDGTNSGTNYFAPAIGDQSPGNPTSVMMNGYNTWVLAGTNTYTGSTTVNAGELDLNTSGGWAVGGNVLLNGGNMGLLQSNQINSSGSLSVRGGTFNIGANTQTLANVQLAGGVIAGTSGTLTSVNSYDIESGTAGAILAGGAGVTKTTSGTATLAGANVYGGLTTVSAGELDLNAPSNQSVPGNVLLNGGNLVLLQSNQITSSGSISITSGTLNIGTYNQGFVNVQLAGGAIAGSGGTLTSMNDYDVEAGSISANLAGQVSLNKTTSGTVVLSGTNTYTGLTNINDGALTAGGVNVFGGGGSLIFNGGALQYSGSNTTDYSASIVNSAGAVAIDTNGQKVTFSTPLASSNTGGFTKLGSGTLTFAAANNYSGTTNINGGALNAGYGGAVFGGGNISFGGGALQYSSFNTNDYSSQIVSSSGAVSIDTNGQDVTFTSPLSSSNTGGLTKLGSGTLTLASVNNYSGVTSINGGVLDAGSGAGVFGTETGLSFGGGTLQYSSANTIDYSGMIVSSTRAISIDTDGQNITYATPLAASNTGGLTKLGSGTLTLTATNTYTGTTTVNGGELDLNATGGAAITGNLAVNGGVVQLLQPSQMKSSANLVIDSGTFIVNGVQVALSQVNIGAISSPSQSFVTVTSGGTLTSTFMFAGYSSAGTLSINGGYVSDSQSFIGYTSSGTGTVNMSSGTWTSPSTLYIGYSGNGTMTISGGLVSDASALINGNSSASHASGSVNVTGGSWINSGSLVVGVSGTGNLTISGGTVTVGSSGTGIVVLASGSTGTGILNYAGGILNAGTITGGAGKGTLEFTSTGSSTFTSAITGSAAVIMNGSGNVTLTGSSNYAGGTLIKSGTLAVNPGGWINQSGTSIIVGNSTGDNGALFVAGGSVVSGSTIIASGSGSTGVVMISSGTFNPGNSNEFYVGLSGSGGLIMKGGYISAGDVRFGYNSGAIGTGVISGGTLTCNQYLVVGSGTTTGGGAGSLLINGGYVNVQNDPVVIADYVGSSGTVTIASGSLATNTLIVAKQGAGVLNINGGSVSTYDSIVGDIAASSGTVNMTSGTWNVTQELSVGSGSGVLNISGGYIYSWIAAISSGSGQAPAVATISGGTWNPTSLFVGTGGNGVLNINGNGVVNVYNGNGSLQLGNGASTVGTLNLGGGTLNATAISTNNHSTGILNFTNSGSITFAVPIQGAVNVNQTGVGITVLTASNSYTGSTSVAQGTLRINGSNASSSGFGVSSGATLGGSGVVSNISGAGTVAPGGNSILTASQVNPSGSLDFDFHFSLAGALNYGSSSASGNDVLHLTGATPFAFSLTSANVITLDFTGQILQAGQNYYGGIFTDADIANSVVDNATFDYTGLNGATMQFDGMVPVSSAPFATGTVSNGEVMEFTVAQQVPSAPVWMLVAMGAGLVVAGWRRARA